MSPVPRGKSCIPETEGLPPRPREAFHEIRVYTAPKVNTRRLVGWGALMVVAGLATLAVFWPAPAARAQRPVGPVIQVARIDGVINVATARFATRVIEEAERRDAQLLVFTLDTPGGYDTAVRQIVQRILGANGTRWRAT